MKDRTDFAMEGRIRSMPRLDLVSISSLLRCDLSTRVAAHHGPISPFAVHQRLSNPKFVSPSSLSPSPRTPPLQPLARAPDLYGPAFGSPTLATPSLKACISVHELSAPHQVIRHGCTHGTSPAARSSPYTSSPPPQSTLTRTSPSCASPSRTPSCQDPSPAHLLLPLTRRPTPMAQLPSPSTRTRTHLSSSIRPSSTSSAQHPR